MNFSHNIALVYYERCCMVLLSRMPCIYRGNFNYIIRAENIHNAPVSWQQG